ncbi:helix-turn-helix domain-containing protein [Noviherbaspirillum galbum]|uniref:Helix-turn-helix transcriptional regulator n=1 Tax=Noviherbaspirillum galbum TaxID=2709383 RepID=A0A6B3SYW0_9BURK|nr:helix-turn-helix transcriptional regulator [Noviherbaspirillum galbum]NEX63379.1 helix-turn-helix transcriptional regulator [Noviherbaspirillum galbum]
MSEKATPTGKSAKTPKASRVPPFRERSAGLIYEMHNKMASHGHSMKDLADIVGVSYPHMTALMAGDRWWAGTDRDVIEKLAKYLEVPVLQVYFWSGFLQPGDQHFDEDLQTRANEVFKRARSDPYTGPIMCSEASWNAAALDLKSMVTILLEVIHQETSLKLAETERGLSTRLGFAQFRREKGIGS